MQSKGRSGEEIARSLRTALGTASLLGMFRRIVSPGAEVGKLVPLAEAFRPFQHRAFHYFNLGRFTNTSTTRQRVKGSVFHLKFTRWRVVLVLPQIEKVKGPRSALKTRALSWPV